MWFLGFIIGAMIGGAIGSLFRWDEAWLFFGALGILTAVLMNKKAPVQSAAPQPGDLERRVAELEREVRALKDQRGYATDAKSTSSPVSEEAAAPVPFPLPQVTVETVAEAVPPPQPEPAARPKPEAAAPKEPSWLWQKLFGGNILAKVGVLLLLFGIGSGLKLAIDFGVFPPSVRLLLATVTALAMIGFGFSRMRVATHRMFGLALQGGGFGVLYLVTYFAFARYGYLDALAAFALFAALGLVCLFTAMRFEGEALAILGITGAFLAPLLASTGKGSHIVLFSYYAVLNVMVLAVYALRAWRVLTVLAFAFTLVTGMTWASARYVPEFFVSTEIFLIVFALMFSLVPFASALMKRVPRDHWGETVLLFGTPIAAAIAQAWLFDQTGFARVALAWSAVAGGLYYSALAAILFSRQSDHTTHTAHSAIAVGLYTIAVPLAFGVEVTSAFWAIEGLVLTWFGIAHRRGLPYTAGLALQLVSGAYFLLEWHGARVIPILNGLYVGSIVIAGCGTASAWITRRGADSGWPQSGNARSLAALLGTWALIWWLRANFGDIARFAAQAHESALYIGLLVVTSGAAYALGKTLPWTGARYVALFLAALAMLTGLFEGGPMHNAHRHALHDTMVFALPAAFAAFYVLLRRHDRDGYTALVSTAHVFGLLVLAATLLREALWIAEQLARGVTLWRLLAWQLVPVALTFGVIAYARQQIWPVAAHRGAYLAAAAPMLLAVAFAAALYANFHHAGGATGLPYLPVASFFDLSQIAVMVCLVAWMKAAASIRFGLVSFARGTAALLGFVWLSAMAMRIAFHWGGVPFETHALLASGIAQSTLSFMWTALALALMVSATRKVLRSRWFVGFALLAVVGVKFILVDVANQGTIAWSLSLIGVGLLILAASYFSPAPPRSAPIVP
ncbi:MAG TPA: DUF2339 domain-containing protein [Burkholderiales bacterium]|nr:DUF2339 domain-containing protein [Burkholderiales bacterium]